MTPTQFVKRLTPLLIAVATVIVSPSSVPAAPVSSHVALANTYDAWAVAPVDTTQEYCSGIWNVPLGIDGAGMAHIAYRSGLGDAILYAHQGQNGVSVTPILTTTQGRFGSWVDLQLDSHGYPHIIYTLRTSETGNDPDSLRYTRWDGTAWVTSVIKEAGAFDKPELALTKQDQPRVVYTGHQEGVTALHYVALEQSTWVEQGTIADAVLGGFAIDSQGRAHMALQQNNGIAYRRYDGSNVVIEMVENRTATYESGIIPELTLDSNDNVHIVYPFADVSDFGPSWLSMHYAKKVGGEWHIETPTGALPTSRASITIDATGQPHIIAQVQFETTGDFTGSALLSYVHSENGSWTHQTITTPGADQGFGIATDALGNTRVAYCASNYPQKPVISYAFQVPPRAFLPAIQR